MTATCHKCGASIKVETDDKRFADKCIAEFKKKHSRCKVKK